MFDYVTHAIVRILDAEQRPVGAGCLVRDRLIVTCAHVVAAALDLPRDAAEPPGPRVTLDFPFVPANVAKARVVLWWPYREAIAGDRRHDLAVLELEHPLDAAEPARLLKPGHERPEPIQVYGFPTGAGLGGVGDWIEGRVAPPLPNGWLKLIQRDRQAGFIEPGCSGGPVIVDGTGLVAGIVSLRRLGSGPPEAYGISAAVIREALNESGAGSGGSVDVLPEEPTEEVRPLGPHPASEPLMVAEPPTTKAEIEGPESSVRSRIFLAHANEDKPRVRQLYEDLKARGFEPWLDELDLIPGQVWRVEIAKAIREAGLFLACLSSRSVGKKGFVQSEFRTALMTFGERPPDSIWLIPVKLDDCEIPDLQIPNRGIGLRDIQWLDLSQEKGFERLIRTMEVGLRVIDVSSLPGPGGQRPAGEADTPRNALARLLVGLQRRVIPFMARRSHWAASIALVTFVVMLAGGTLTVVRVFDVSGPGPDRLVREALVSGTVQPHPLPGLPIETGAAPFRDCDECPEMVVAPAGSFMMGSHEDEQGRFDGEGPQKEVTIAGPFAIGKYEVTFDEWDACLAGGGCSGYKPRHGWGRGRQPVVNVSWGDAQAYVSWLEEQTGKSYRLPSAAEWEYAARAGTKTRYSWGDDISPKHANYARIVGATTEAGSYEANPWGLHDVHGNVWEWVDDCWNDNYEGTPDDGSAWATGDCSRRVVRGGSWVDYPSGLRSAYRGSVETVGRGSNLGFRVARGLPP